MTITHKVTMDMAKKQAPAILDVVQGDSARALQMELLENGAPWEIPENVSVIVRYAKPDGTGGTYDTLPDGAAAWSARGNTLILALAPQLCSISGAVTVQICLVTGQMQISTFAFVLRVLAEVTGEEASEDYTNLSKWLAEFGGAGGYAHVENLNNPHQVTKEQLGLADAATNAYVDSRTGDYIVSQGTSGVWEYRKWASGFAECWGYPTVAVAVTDQQNSLYTSGAITLPTYPFTFITVPTSFCDIRQNKTSMLWAGLRSNQSSTSPGIHRVKCTTSIAEFNAVFQIYAVGQWK